MNRASPISWVLGERAKEEAGGSDPHLWGKTKYSQETE